MSEDQITGAESQVATPVESPVKTEQSDETPTTATTTEIVDGANAVLAANEATLRMATDPVVQNAELSADDFEEILDAFGPVELTLIIEGLAESKPSRDIFRKVQKVRRKFDPALRAFNAEIKKLASDDATKAEKSETALAAEFRTKIAFAKLAKAREEFEAVDQKEKEENSIKKKALLEKLKDIVDKQDVTALEEVRNIQKEWKETGQVKSEDMDSMYQAQKEYLDKFYDMRKKYVALIEIDRKVNYDKKLSLIKEVYSLVPSYDPNVAPESEAGLAYLNAEFITNLSKDLPRNYWQEASDKIKSVHENWKATGAVSRENSEKVWNDFKVATDVFFTAKRLFFGSLDAEREDNEKTKRDILLQAEAFSNPTFKSVDSWKTSSETLIALRTKWNETGPAPQAVNTQLNESFRQILDAFFEERKKYYSQLDSQKEVLGEKKKLLVEQAEALKDSDDWRSTTDKLIELQKQWDSLGDDNFKEGRVLRKQFRKACDSFFRRKSAHVKTIQDSENKAMEVKMDCVKRIEDAIAKVTESPVKSIDEAPINATDLQAIRETFNAAGRVPLKEKDKIQMQFNAAFAGYINLTVSDISERKKLMSNSRGGSGGSGSGGGGNFQRGNFNSGGDIDPKRDERALQKKLKSIEEKIQLFKNNITFFASSKSNSALLKDIQSKIEAALQDKAQTEKLISQLRETRVKEKEPKTNKNEAPTTVPEVTVAEEVTV